MGRAANDKKSRLVAAAADLFHRRGLTSTSLANVAHHAEVPQGNVYYYFRSKNDLAAAVADEWLRRVDRSLDEVESDTDPWERLSSFIARAERCRSDYAVAGCPIAGLNRDLRQIGGDLAVAAAPAYERQLAWLAAQFAAGGVKRDDAEGHARFLLAAIQGSFLVGHALHDERLIGTVFAGIDHWFAGLRAAAA